MASSQAGKQASLPEQLQQSLEIAQSRVKELERASYLLKQENEDLRVNLKINKESLQTLLQAQPKEETALIKTINLISSENVKLQIALDRLRAENEQLKSVMVRTQILIACRPGEASTQSRVRFHRTRLL